MNNATILRELNHVGKPASVESWDRPGDEPQRPPTENERIVQAWRESGKAQEPISLPECGAIGAEMDNVSGGAKLGVLAWAFVDGRSGVEKWLADTGFDSEDYAWYIGLGFPSPEEIEHYKANGCRVVRVRIVPVESEGQG